MFQKLEMPLFIQEAIKQKKPRALFIELLLFGAVFWIAGMVESILMVPFTVIAMLGHTEELRALVEMGDMGSDATLEFVAKLYASPVLIIGSLFATVGMIVTVIIYCRFLEKRRLSTMGLLRPFGKEYAVGALIGLVLFGVYIIFSMALGGVGFLGLSESFHLPTVLLLLLGYLVQGFSEEILCRGYFMTSLCRTMPLPVALAVSSLFFSLLHIGNTGFDLLSFVNVFLFGILMGLYVIRRGNLWGACALHALWNFAEGVLTDFTVSGLAMPSSVFSFQTEGASTFIIGGAFGPEGGFAVTFVLTLGVVILLMMQGKSVNNSSQINTP